MIDKSYSKDNVISSVIFAFVVSVLLETMETESETRTGGSAAIFLNLYKSTWPLSDDSLWIFGTPIAKLNSSLLEDNEWPNVSPFPLPNILFPIWLHACDLYS